MKVNTLNENYSSVRAIGFRFDDRCNRSYSRTTYSNTGVSFTFPRNPKTYKKRLYEHHRGLKWYQLNTTFTERARNSSGQIMDRKSLSIRDGI